MTPDSDGQLRLCLGQVSAQVDLLGGELRSLRRGNDEVLWQNESGVWPHAAPILFPFVGRLKGGGFKHRDKYFQMPIHGFAGHSRFEVEPVSGGHCVVLHLRDSLQTQACYPFKFQLRVSFVLNPQGIDVGYTVFNEGAEVLPFALGSHPAFALGSGRLQDWKVEFDQHEAPEVYRLDAGLLAERPQAFCFDPVRSIGLQPETFVADALIFKHVNSTWISLVHKQLGPRLRLWTGGAPHLGLWAPAGADFVCIEPWFGVDEDAQACVDLAEKSGLQRLAPGARFACGYRIEFAAH